ncbi:MAG: hypothetical protein V2G37_04980 [bacterium JZ-2024 1]
MKLLVVTEVFPPVLSAPSIVVGKAVKYLLREGWKVSVLTGRRSAMEDPYLLEDTGQVESLYEFRLRGYADYPPLLRPFVKNFYGLTPYRGSGLWYKSARDALRKILAQEPFDVIFGINASSPAIVRLVAEVEAPKTIKAVWYIDPWYISSLHGFRDAVKGFFWRSVEKALLRSFHLVLLNSESLLHAYQKALPEMEDIFSVCLQGFDPEDFSALKSGEVVPPPEFRIGYFGSVRPEEIRAIKILMESLALLPPEIRSYVEVYVQEWITSSRQVHLQKYFSRLRSRIPECQRFFRLYFLPASPYRKTLAEMGKMDAFLVSRDLRYKFHHTGKIFQYLAFRKPILFIGPGGSADGELVERAGCGKAFDIVNRPVKNLAEYISSLFYQKMQGISSVSIPDAFYENLKTPVHISRLSQKLLSLLKTIKY